MNYSMNMYEFPDTTGIAVCGDIHGNYKELVHKCCIQYGMRDTLIIVAGDCGFGFDKFGYYDNTYKQCSKRLTSFNNYVVFIRGNHDNPAYFDGKQANYKRWKALPDYSVLRACDHTILCVGGAISVDRVARTLDRRYVVMPKDPLTPNLYWHKEHPVFDQTKLDSISEVYRIDTVITHTAPSFCELTSHAGLEYFTRYNEGLMDDIKYERRTMDRLHGYLKEHGHPLQFWYYGHFHQSWHAEIEGVRFNMIDCMELRKIPE